jgi:MFS family permease
VLVLVLVGLYIRTAISESPVFKAAQERAAAAAEEHKAPIIEVVRDYRREVLIAMGARFAENVCYYVFTVFVLSYATEHLGLSRSFALNAVLVASAIHLVAIPLWGALSDRYGRWRLYLIGAAGVGVWAFVFFPLIDTRSWPLVVLSITGGLFFHAAMYGPQAAYFSELFSTKVRYTGASIGYQLASILAGSLAPIIAVALLARFGSSLPISPYMLGTAVVTIGAVLASHETSRVDLAADDGKAAATTNTAA